MSKSALQTEIEELLKKRDWKVLEKAVRSNPDLLPILFDYCLNIKNPLAWRACWSLRKLKLSSRQLQSFPLQKALLHLPEANDSHQRELFMLLDYLPIEEDDLGRIFDLATLLWTQIDSKSSTRAMGFSKMLMIAEKHPELLAEIEPLTAEHYFEGLSPGIEASLRKKWRKARGSSKPG